MIGFSILVGVITLEVAASRIVATEGLNAQINLSDETLKFYQDHLADLHHLRTLIFFSSVLNDTCALDGHF